MKKLFTLILSALSLLGFAQSTATNFNANDCSSANHMLFTELDAGKVVVICWVMPCGACISSAAADASAVQGFASSNPGRVKFYIVDDSGNSTCSTLTGWESTNGITADATFSNAGNVIKMSDYGTSGMPKTIVLGGTSHTVFYNQNGSVSSSALNSAIQNALNSTTGIAEQAATVSDMNVFPNPAINATSVSYSLSSASEVKVELYNMVGQNVRTVFSGNQPAGEYKTEIDCAKLQSGIYFVKLIAGRTEKTIMLSVSH